MIYKPISAIKWATQKTISQNALSMTTHHLIQYIVYISHWNQLNFSGFCAPPFDSQTNHIAIDHKIKQRNSNQYTNVYIRSPCVGISYMARGWFSILCAVRAISNWILLFVDIHSSVSRRALFIVNLFEPCCSYLVRCPLLFNIRIRGKKSFLFYFFI